MYHKIEQLVVTGEHSVVGPLLRQSTQLIKLTLANRVDVIGVPVLTKATGLSLLELRLWDCTLSESLDLKQFQKLKKVVVWRTADVFLSSPSTSIQEFKCTHGNRIGLEAVMNNCPVLEELSISEMHMDPIFTTLDLSALESLKRLEVHRCPNWNPCR